MDVLAIDRALARLATIDADQARIVELRFFAGLTVDEIAYVLRRSPRTVKHEWRLAKAWLYRELPSSSYRSSPVAIGFPSDRHFSNPPSTAHTSGKPRRRSSSAARALVCSATQLQYVATGLPS
jgi:hypothetical protein